MKRDKFKELVEKIGELPCSVLASAGPLPMYNKERFPELYKVFVDKLDHNDENVAEFINNDRPLPDQKQYTSQFMKAFEEIYGWDLNQYDKYDMIFEEWFEIAS